MKLLQRTVLTFLGILFIFSLFAQAKPESNDGLSLGSASILHKKGNADFDRWELVFHDYTMKNKVIWTLIKTVSGQKLKSGNYKFRRKSFEDLAKNQALAIWYKDNRETPVISGKLNLVLSETQIHIKANIKALGIEGKKRLEYSGKYKIIEIH